METIEQIEEQIRAKNQEITDATREARLKNQVELQRLHSAKLRLLAQKNKQSSDYLKQLQPIINSIIEIAMRINHGGLHTLFIDYSGHVKCLKIYSCKGEWAAHKERENESRVYLDLDTPESFQVAKKELLQIERELENLEESTHE